MTRLPDMKGVFEIIYRHKSKSAGIREFYLEGKEVMKYLEGLGVASVMSVTHGVTFKPVKWKVRKLK